MKAERRRKEAATTTFHTGLASECAKSKKCNYDMLQCARRIGWRKCFGPKQVARAFPPHAQPHIIVNGILGESSLARCQLKVFPSLMSVFVALRDVIGFAINHSRWRLFYFGEIPRVPQTANSSIMSIHLRGSRDFNARVGLNQNNSSAPTRNRYGRINVKTRRARREMGRAHEKL